MGSKPFTLPFLGGGAASQGLNASQVQAAISSNSLGLNLKEYANAAGDGVTDDTAKLQAAISYANANGDPCFLPYGDFLVSASLVSTANTFTMIGAGMGHPNPSITMQAGLGLDVMIVQSVAGAASQGGSCSGSIQNISFVGGTAGGGVAGQRCLVVEGLAEYLIQRCSFNRTDIGLDFQNNDLGSVVIGCQSYNTLTRLGCYLRGSNLKGEKGTGADLSLYDNWFGGSIGGVWAGPNLGGYHLYGGQLTCSPSVATEAAGGFVFGMTYVGIPDTTLAVACNPGDTSITCVDTTGLIGNGAVVLPDGQLITYGTNVSNVLGGIPSSGTGSIQTACAIGSYVCNSGQDPTNNLHGVSFEAVTRASMIRGFNQHKSSTLIGLNFNSTNNAAISAVKISRAQASALDLQGCIFQGNFTGPLVYNDHSPITNGGSARERSCSGSGNFNTASVSTPYNLLTGTSALSYSGIENCEPFRLAGYSDITSASSVTLSPGGYMCKITASLQTVTLATAALKGKNQEQTIKLTASTGNVTIVPASGSSDTIEGLSSLVITNSTKLSSVTLISDGVSNYSIKFLYTG